MRLTFMFLFLPIHLIAQEYFSTQYFKTNIENTKYIKKRTMLSVKYLKFFEEHINESFNQAQIEKVIDKVYPKIVKDLGGKAKLVEVYDNMWDRLGAVAVDDLKREQGNPNAEYDPDDDIIYIYSEKTNTSEQIIRSLLHEHTHTIQDQKEFKKLYNKGYKYSNHPFELEALEAEKAWKNYK